VLACKGLEPGTGRLPHEVVKEVLGTSHPLAVLSGPTFAKDIGMGSPTGVTIASPDTDYAEDVARLFHGAGFRAYTSDDIVGVEVGGAVKNVLAIAVGAADGLGLGANTRTVLITRGLAEIMRLGEALGANRDTLMGLSGIGDLVLTATDNQSRNRRFGLAMAQGKSVEQALAEIKQVVEGVRVAPEVLRRARQLKVEMPITEQVVAVLSGKVSPLEALKILATRPSRAEMD
jgi:glycerol-3-phosphate dehydrogenase (NAD(P)+)